MTDTSGKSQEVIQQIKDWQDQVVSYSKTFNDQQIKEILRSIPKQKLSENNAKEYLLTVSGLIGGLASISFDTETIEGK